MEVDKTKHVFFISDTHFNHENILKYENRPFNSVKEMNEEMIKLWNSVVKPGDVVYHLGDVGVKKDNLYDILNQLNGTIYLIKGNHDYSILNDTRIVNRFEWVKDYHVIRKLINKKIILFHFPIQVWDSEHYGAIHLFGHIHSNPNNVMKYQIPNSFNVSADVIGLKPISLYDILKQINKEE